MTCIHCGGRIEPLEPAPAAGDSVLATLVEAPAGFDAQQPALCRDCAALVPSTLPAAREVRAESYCLWCRRPLADDGKTPRQDAAPLPTDSDACVIFRECRDCRQSRGTGPGQPFQLRPR
jgi:hypothetical protein